MKRLARTDGWDALARQQGGQAAHVQALRGRRHIALLQRRQGPSAGQAGVAQTSRNGSFLAPCDGMLFEDLLQPSRSVASAGSLAS